MLTRYNPYPNPLRAHRLITRLLDEAFAPTVFDPFSPLTSWQVNTFEVDMFETDDKVVVKASIPGARPENVQVEEQNGTLSIRVKVEDEREGETSGWFLHERRYGEWRRTVLLPAEVRGEKASAELENGILTVTLPKVESGRSLVNRIKVNLPKLRLPGMDGSRRKEKRVKVRTSGA